MAVNPYFNAWRVLPDARSHHDMVRTHAITDPGILRDLLDNRHGFYREASDPDDSVCCDLLRQRIRADSWNGWWDRHPSCRLYQLDHPCMLLMTIWVDDVCHASLAEYISAAFSNEPQQPVPDLSRKHMYKRMNECVGGPQGKGKRRPLPLCVMVYFMVRVNCMCCCAVRNDCDACPFVVPTREIALTERVRSIPTRLRRGRSW
jgi:hypothetical protein